MSIDEDRRAFADLYATDAQFAETIASAPSMSRAVSIAAERGFLVNADTIRAVLTGEDVEAEGIATLDLHGDPTASEEDRLRY